MENKLKRRPSDQKLPSGFWRLIVVAVLVGNAGMMAALWLGAPDWLAVSLPIAAVGLVGILLEHRRRNSKKSDE